jgi:hypothetical protein
MAKGLAGQLGLGDCGVTCQGDDGAIWLRGLRGNKPSGCRGNMVYGITGQYGLGDYRAIWLR